MKNFIIYSISTGKIIRSGTCQGDLLEAQVLVSDEAVLPGVANHSLCYIEQGEVIDRPVQATTTDKMTLSADGVDVITLSNVPINATFTAKNMATGEQVSGPIGGIDTFSTTIPGIYEIKIESWPHLDFEATIEAI